MSASLEIISGSDAGEKFVLPLGKRMKVGRANDADIYLRADPLVSDLQFAIWSDEGGCYIEDLSSQHGTLLNGREVRQGVIKNGDEIVAGITHFLVRIGEVAPARVAGDACLFLTQSIKQTLPNASYIPAIHDFDGVLQILRTEAQPLFAILDAARDSKVSEWLRTCGQECQSLYAGARGQELADCAPYLVLLPPDSRALATLVRTSWGKGWGIFLTSSASFKEIRRHFRRLLIVQTEDKRKLYFRFYDPLVLNRFLPSCVSTELSQMFGPVSAYWTEDGCADVLRELTFKDSKLYEKRRKPNEIRAAVPAA
jgi:hypothetical protein